ncbi:hypothetical protein NHX12_027746 [Muraenolepis orangiensis]|uniref:Uncharacterized protein n=1 Tax=Muraenolepis orangiensis TaxID=630683 RepID=A0A9Q0EJK2_9TELE|nr:hypothetical protein NHX12_027746 [Muraenolepis orangiensis]
MDKTFSLRRQEIVDKESGVEELNGRWPALFTMDEINAEFTRITTVPLTPRFLASLDKHHGKLIDIVRNKGGVVRETTRDLLLDQVVQKDEAETELERCAMAVFVIREEEDPLQPPHDIGIIIEGVEVMNQLPSFAHACAMLFGFIYALNLSYPSQLKYTFDALQKLFMGIEPKQMTRRVCSLSVKLQVLNDSDMYTPVLR